MITCSDCGGQFGGTFIFSRHLDRRRLRCLGEREMRLRGVRDMDGVWHQPTPVGRTARLPGTTGGPGGSRRLEDRAGSHVVRGGASHWKAQGSTPQQKEAVSQEPLL